MLRPTVSRCQAPIWGLRPNFYYCQTVASLLSWALSLTREWVCRLQLLLVFASAVILGSGSRGTRDHILLSQIRDSPNLEGQVPVFISPGTGWPSYTPRHWVPFLSPPTIRRATVEVFEPASARDRLSSNFVSFLLHLGKDHIETPSFQQYPCCCAWNCCCGNVFTEPFPRNCPGISTRLTVVL
jgi:hypothetical protein